MASAAIAFSVKPFMPQDNNVLVNLQIESRSSAGGNWRHVRDETVWLKEINVITQLNRAYYAYRLSLKPAVTDMQYFAALPFYVEIPQLTFAPSLGEAAETCPLEIGAFTLLEQLQCPLKEQHRAVSASVSQVVGNMLSGTFAAAFLVFSLLPCLRAKIKHRCCKRFEEQNRALKNGSEIRPIPDEGSRWWKSFGGHAIEPARAYHKKNLERMKRPTKVKKNAVPDTGSELLLAKLPDFNDDRGWRDFFDAHVYYNEPEAEQRAIVTAMSRITSRSKLIWNDSIGFASTKLQERKINTCVAAAGTKTNRYTTIRDRIDRAAIEAAINEMQSFSEFWQT